MSVSLSAGDEIGRFQIVERVGRGGMGVVYRAFDPQLERPVALKLLAPHLGEDEDALARFHREAALIAKLKHNHIAVIYDYGQHDEQPYIAMEWVEGRTLKQLLAQEGVLAVERALGLLNQLAEGLDYAHKQGVVHRDLKPANIIIGPDDEATIVDFGLAWIENATTLTATNSVIGTPRYMSPEQIQGHDVNGRSDQYSLAIIVYEMVSGELPFNGDQPSVLFHQQISAPPPPIRQKNRQLSGTVENALDRALSKKPADRFETASEFRDAVSGEIHVESRRRRALRRKRPSWVIRWLLLPIVLALIVGLAFAFRDPMGAFLLNFGGQETAEIDPETGEPIFDYSSEPEYGDYWIGSGGDPQQSRYTLSLGDYKDESSQRWAHVFEEPLSGGLVGDFGILATFAGDSLYLMDWVEQEAIQPFPLGEEAQSSLAIFASEQDSLLFVPTADGSLTALDTITGTLRWRQSADAFDGLIVGMTANEESSLFVTTDSGTIYRLDLFVTEDEESGEAIETELGTPQHLFASELRLDFAPTIVPSGVVIAGEVGDSGRGQLVTLAGMTGDVVWEQPLDAPATVPPISLGEGGLVVVGLENGRLSAHTLLTGDVQWEATFDAAITGLTTDDFWIYVTTADNQMDALLVETGERAWEGSPFSSDAPFSTPPVTDSEIIAIGTQAGEILFIDGFTGEQIEDQTLIVTDAPIEAIAPLGGWLFVSSDNTIFAFSPAP